MKSQIFSCILIVSCYYGNASLRSDAQNHLYIPVESEPLEVDFRPLVIYHRPLTIIRKYKCSLVSTHILLKNVKFLKSTVLSSPYFVKKSFILPKQNSLMSFFFQIIPEKPPAVKPILINKRQFCQNWDILWAIKVNRMPFFPIFHEKITALMPILCQKTYIL